MAVRSDTDVHAKEPLVAAGSAPVVQTKESLMEARTHTDVQDFFTSDGGSKRYRRATVVTS